MGTLLQDLKYGLRMLARNPGFTAVAVITLALGIGANTAIFSVLNAVLLHPLPYKDPDQLVVIWENNASKGIEHGIVSPLDFLDWRDQSHSFEEISAWRTWFYTLTGRGEAEQVWGVRTSANFFRLLGVRAALGRTFLPGEELAGHEHVVVLSHGIWERRFARDPSLLGQTITVDHKPFTVVGILPPDFNLFGGSRAFDFWMPFVLQRDQLRRGDPSIMVYARVKPGVTLSRAQTEMTSIARQLEQEYPATNSGLGAQVVTFHETQVGDLRPALLIMLVAVGLVLAIACVNVANLLLARTATRQKEIAIRAALGAGRLRLIRQLLAESLLLATAGGILGVVLAFWGLDLLRAISPPSAFTEIPHANWIGIDRSVLAFTLLTSILVGVIFGLVPAFQISKPGLNETLKEGGRALTESFRSSRLRGLLVVTEVALAIMLLVAAGLTIKSFMKLLEVNPGLNPRNILTMQVWLPESKYPDGHQVASFYREALLRIGALPGVQSASATDFLPLSGWGDHSDFAIEGQPPPEPGHEPVSDYRVIDPNYFRTMQVPLKKGRFFSHADGAVSPGVAIINETLARRYWPHDNPIGKRLRPLFPAAKAPWRPESNNSWLTIVGVVGDVRDQALTDDPSPEILLPCSQNPSRLMRLVIRTTAEPLSLASAVRHELLALDKDQPVMDIKTLEQFISESVFRPRLNLFLLGIFAGLALTLAALGIYSVTSYSVVRRRHEIGIRMALGAGRRDVVKLVMGQGFRLTLAGVAIGLVGGLALTRFLASLLFAVRPTDPTTFIAVSILLAVVSLLASYVPARRAMKVDPMVALRYE